MKVLPVGRRVLVKRDEIVETTDWGFELQPDQIEREQSREAYGTVVAVAEEAYDDVYERKQCGPGDRVIFRAYAGVNADKEDRNLMLLNDQDILAILVED